MSGLPEQAVDERVLALIHECGQVVRPQKYLNDVYHCGCVSVLAASASWATASRLVGTAELRPTPRGDLWFLCQYHDGVNDGLAIADGAGS